MKSHLRNVVGVVLTILLLLWVLRDVSPAEVARELAAADLTLLALSVLITIGGFAVRAIRWGVLLTPVERSLPSSIPICRICSSLRGSPARWFNARSVAAASELPPPNPAATGIRLISLIRAPPCPTSSKKRPAARTTRFFSSGPVSSPPSTSNSTPSAAHSTHS